MPNWVTNILTFDCDEAKMVEIRYAISSEKLAIDFNKIVPMPESLNITSSSEGDKALHALYYKQTIKKSAEDPYGEEDWNDAEKYKSPYSSDALNIIKQSFSDEAIKLAKQYKYNLDNYGFRTWYDWRVANWGAKWNASSIENGDFGIRFDTAWTTPLPVIRRISQMFPDVKLTIEFADEDIGQNCGVYVLKDGEILSFEEGDEDFAYGVKGWAKEEDD